MTHAVYEKCTFSDDMSSISGSELESESEENVTLETGDILNGNLNNGDASKSNNKSNKRIEKKENQIISESSDDESSEDATKKKRIDALVALASRHSKVFFENDEGHIFSIYRCLLHSKKVKYAF